MKGLVIIMMSAVLVDNYVLQKSWIRQRVWELR